MERAMIIVVSNKAKNNKTDANICVCLIYWKE